MKRLINETMSCLASLWGLLPCTQPHTVIYSSLDASAITLCSTTAAAVMGQSHRDERAKVHFTQSHVAGPL